MIISKVEVVVWAESNGYTPNKRNPINPRERPKVSIFKRTQNKQ